MRTHPLQLVLLLVGVALAFALPFEKPGVSKRRKKGAPAEAAVPAVGGAWSDARTLQAYLAAAVKQVPDATGAKFLEEPIVRVSTAETVAGILREDYDAAFRRMGAKDDATVAALSRAFACQVVAVMRGLGVDEWDERLNVNGGAIALGHPLGATGARMVGTMAYEMERRGARWGLTTLCIGSGMGMSVAWEREG